MATEQPQRASPNQTAAIPFRRTTEGTQVCLIRRKDSRSWGIPKGFIDRGETLEQAALKEAFEEAGVLGRISGESLGTYYYEKQGRGHTVALYLLDVLEVLPAWEEMTFRERSWYAWEDAVSMLASHPVRPLLDRVRTRLTGNPEP